MKIEAQESKYEVGDVVESVAKDFGEITKVNFNRNSDDTQPTKFHYLINQRWVSESDIICKMERVK